MGSWEPKDKVQRCPASPPVPLFGFTLKESNCYASCMLSGLKCF